MAKQKDKWTNVTVYGKDEYLPAEEYARIKERLRKAWRSLGWVHLRMTNDMDADAAVPLPRPELLRRLAGVREELDRLIDEYLSEEG